MLEIDVINFAKQLNADWIGKFSDVFSFEMWDIENMGYFNENLIMQIFIMMKSQDDVFDMYETRTRKVENF